MTVIEKIVAKAVWPKIDAPIEAHGHVPATIIEFKQREAYDAAHNIVAALEEAGYRIVTDPPKRPDWSEDKYGIELWFHEYKEWLKQNGCPDAAQG